MIEDDPPCGPLPPIPIVSAEVLEFPFVHRKALDSETVIRVVDKKYFGVCQHNRYLYDDEKADVECADCHEKLNPMWVLKRLSQSESALQRRYIDLRAEVETLKPKLRQQCEHCGKMTKIKSLASAAELFDKRMELEYGKKK